MATIEVDLQKLSVLDQEIIILERKKKSLENELERLANECNRIKDMANKEIAQQKQLCESECQEKLNKAGALLEDVNKKLSTADKRIGESLVIEKQIKELDKKTKEFKEREKQIELAQISCAEREKKADLIIEQYKKKIDELNK